MLPFFAGVSSLLLDEGNPKRQLSKYHVFHSVPSLTLTSGRGTTTTTPSQWRCYPEKCILLMAAKSIEVAIFSSAPSFERFCQ